MEGFGERAGAGLTRRYFSVVDVAPAHWSTGRRGYFGKFGSVAESWQR
jgi:hypothetical protein